MSMQATINELMDKLGVGYVLGPYQTHPWSYYDSGKGITCSAEVRVDPDGNEVEAEAQFMYDTPPNGKPPMEQICLIRAAPISEGRWNVTHQRIRGEHYGKDISRWEEKSCLFFSLLVQALQQSEIPDVEALIEEAFKGKDRYHDQYGGGGGKSPKIKPGALLNMGKGGRGF